MRDCEDTHDPSLSRYFFGFAGDDDPDRARPVIPTAARDAPHRQGTPNVGVHVVVPATSRARACRKTTCRFAVCRPSTCRGSFAAGPLSVTDGGARRGTAPR